MKLWTTIAFCLITFISFSQDKKLEKEKRLKPAQVPEFIKKLLSPYVEQAKRLRYYEEFDGKTTSYEAKFVLYKNHFSVEFSKEGKLEDVEVNKCFAELPASVQKSIVNHLYPNDNFKIKKAQKQFRSEDLTESELLDIAIKNKDDADIGYELIVQVKKDGKWTTYEMQFDEDGTFISQLEVVYRSEDHLLY